MSQFSVLYFSCEAKRSVKTTLDGLDECNISTKFPQTTLGFSTISYKSLSACLKHIIQNLIWLFLLIFYCLEWIAFVAQLMLRAGKYTGKH